MPPFQEKIVSKFGNDWVGKWCILLHNLPFFLKIYYQLHIKMKILDGKNIFCRIFYSFFFSKPFYLFFINISILIWRKVINYFLLQIKKYPIDKDIRNVFFVVFFFVYLLRKNPTMVYGYVLKLQKKMTEIEKLRGENNLCRVLKDVLGRSMEIVRRIIVYFS